MKSQDKEEDARKKEERRRDEEAAKLLRIVEESQRKQEKEKRKMEEREKMLHWTFLFLFGAGVIYVIIDSRSKHQQEGPKDSDTKNNYRPTRSSLLRQHRTAKVKENGSSWKKFNGSWAKTKPTKMK